MDRINPADWHLAHRVIHGDLAGAVEWLNGGGSFRNPHAYGPALAIAEQLVDGKGIPAIKLREYIAALGPYLDEGHRLLAPTFEIKPTKGKGRAEVSDMEPSSVVAATDCPLDGRIDLSFHHAPESVLVWAVYQLLKLSEGPSPTALKRCGNRDCRRFFLDKSPSKRGRFCSTRCRSKSFRAGK